MIDSSSESEIISGLRDGDRQAWESLCETFEDRLWRHISRLIGNDHAAVCDVFQETLMAVARSGRSISSDTKLWPWLAKIGHNQAALFWRVRYRNKRIESAQVIHESPPTTDNDPAAALMQQETNLLIRRLLIEMDAEYASVLTAKYIEGLSVAQIVELFGGTTESVRSRLARARKDFRNRYQRAVE